MRKIACRSSSIALKITQNILSAVTSSTGSRFRNFLNALPWSSSSDHHIHVSSFPSYIDEISAMTMQ
jgi:hypothetical protein